MLGFKSVLRIRLYPTHSVVLVLKLFGSECFIGAPNYVRAKEVVGTVVVLLAVLLQIDVEVVLREYFNFSNSLVVFVLAIRPRPKIWRRSL